MRVWYEPTISGDFRLEAKSSTTCLLTVEDPTPAELERLEKFLRNAAAKKWFKPGPESISKDGRSELVLKASVLKAGRSLMRRPWYKTGRITVVKSLDGEVTAYDGEDEVEAGKAGGGGKPDAAVTTPRPTTCCPECVEGPEVRSSRVLQEFCTPEQWEQWCEHGALLCLGGLSGHLYRVAHRCSPLAAAEGKAAYDLDAGHKMHAHLTHLPPAEEALALKLVLEHREHWVRNHSGNLSGRGPWYFNPHVEALGIGQGGDGIWDASVTRTVGNAAPKMMKALRVLTATED